MGLFEGSILTNTGKKTKRMKWKVKINQLNQTDTSLKMDLDLNKKVKADLIIHNNPNKTVNINGYVINGKKRSNITIKNMKLTENNFKEKLSELEV